MSRGIVEAHGGKLTLAVPDAGGARFEITLRRAAAGEAVPAMEAQTAAEPGPAAAAHTALIVDDEPEVARILAHLVSAEGYRCDIVPSGAAACRKLQRRDYDLVLCDLHMPDTNGVTLFNWLGTSEAASLRAHGLRHRRHAGPDDAGPAGQLGAPRAGEAVRARRGALDRAAPAARQR